MGKISKRHPNGFTMIEVSLFLALSGAILIASLVGITTTIANQRYREAGEDALSYISGIYSKVINPQHLLNDGSSDHSNAIYGQAIVFSEDGHTINTYVISGNADINTVTNSLDAVLSATDCTTSNVLLSAINHNGASSSDCEKALSTAQNNLGLSILSDDESADSHNLQWQAEALDSQHNNIASTSNNTSTEPFNRIILVIRNPKTSIVNTFVSEKNDFNSNDISSININREQFKTADIDICLRSPDAPNDGYYDLRISENARNSSMVHNISFDDRDNNRCRI